MDKLKQHYFQHDATAGRDEKIIMMRTQYGAKGYGLFWLLVEYLFLSGGTARRDSRILSLAIGENSRTIQKFLDDCIDRFKLFDSDGETFWSKRLNRDIDRIVSVSQANRKAAYKMHENRRSRALQQHDLDEPEEEITNDDGITPAQRLHSDCSTIDNTREDNNTSDDTQNSRNTNPGTSSQAKIAYGHFNNVRLTEKEYTESIERYGQAIHDEAVEFLSSYKCSSGKEYESDYAAMCSWAYERALEKGSKPSSDQAFVPNQEPLPFELDLEASK